MAAHLAVAGDGEDEIAGHQGATERDVAGGDAQVLHHVQAPEDLAVGAGADQFRRGSQVIQAVSLNDRGGQHTIVPSLVHNFRRRHVVSDLPEELAVGFAEAHQDRFGVLHSGVARFLVVGADENFASGDGRRQIAARADRRDPLNILLPTFADHPLGRHVLVERVDHVPLRVSAEHGPVSVRSFRCPRTRGANQKYHNRHEQSSASAHSQNLQRGDW